MRLVERAAEAVEQLVDLVRRDDERRADRDAVAAERAHDQPSSLSEADAGRARRRPSASKARFVRLVGDDLEAADQADAARLADERMIGQRREPRLELRRLGAHAPRRSGRARRSRAS